MTSNRTRRASDGSIVASLACRAWSGSSVRVAIRTSIARNQSIGSALVSDLPAKPLARAVEDSAVAGFAHSVETAVRASFCFRWLTAEPEPEVIVIDLRETYTVGPVIALLDRSLRVLLPASHRSTIIGAAVSVHESVTAAPVRAASLVLGVGVLTDLAVTLTIGEPTQASLVARVSLLGFVALGTRVEMTWDELVETRLVQMLIVALELPEPPEERDE